MVHKVLEKTLESPLDCREIQPVHLKENQSWIFIGRSDAEAGTPVLWPPDAKNWLIGKDLDAGKDWRQEKGTTEHEMVGWHHWLSGHVFEQAPGVGDGQGGLLCCSPWGRRVRRDWVTELTDRYIYTFIQINIVRNSIVALFATAKVCYLFWPYHVAFRIPARGPACAPTVEA